MKKINQIILAAGILAIISCAKDTATEKKQTIPIPNGGFEIWNNLVLQDWQTNSCPFCAPAYETYIVQQDSAPFNGQFAARFIYNNVYPASAENRFSLTTHPVSLNAHVKCDLYGTDTVYVKIAVLKNSVTVDSGQWYGAVSIPNYSSISIPISQNSSQVDSVVITIEGGHKIGFPSNNTVFWVDNLILQ
jgi:hypothetical protein